MRMEAVYLSKKEDRLNNIVKILEEHNGASVKELALMLDVSEMTIRRDLKYLEEKKIIDNFYGSAVFNPRQSNPLKQTNDIVFTYNLNENSRKMEDEKLAIGKKAAELINEDDIVCIDLGTTTERLSQYIDPDLTFTSLIFSANNLIHMLSKPNVKILFSGGSFHRDTGMFESPDALRIVSNTRTTKLFLSAAGVHEKLGMTCANSYEVAIKKFSIENSLEVILLVDSSKFGEVRPSFVCNLDKVDKIITDSGISQEWIDIINKNHIELIIV